MFLFNFLLLSGRLFPGCGPCIGRADFLRCLRRSWHKFSPKTMFFMTSDFRNLLHKHHKQGLKQLFSTASACMLNASYMTQGTDLTQVLESCFFFLAAVIFKISEL